MKTSLSAELSRILALNRRRASGSGRWCRKCGRIKAAIVTAAAAVTL